jgi:hypothetical protein
MDTNYKVSLEFTGYRDPYLEKFGGRVATLLTYNPAFPHPPVEPAQLSAHVFAFRTACQAAMQGGLRFAAARDQAREVLLSALRREAAYVQTRSGHDLEMLLSSGFLCEEQRPCVCAA